MAMQHVTHLTDAYALGALEPDEVDIVERHLDTCAECRTDAQRAAAVAELLLYGAPPAIPSPSLRERTLLRVRAIADEDDRRLRDVPDVQTTSSTAVSPFSRFLRNVFGAGVEPESTPADPILRDLLADPECVIWSVNGTDDAPQASARLIGSRSRRRAVLLTNGLRSPGPGREYQVWFLRDGKPLPNTLFSVDRAGHGVSVVRASEPLRAFDTVAVTPEPAGGSPGPTGPIVLVGQLAQ